MEYRIVDDIETAKVCDDLLTELIMSERKYDKNVKEDYRVNDYFTNIYDKDYNVLICAISDKDVAGFIYGFLKYEKGILVNENVGFIDALYVKSEYQRQGIGSMLVEESMKWLNTQYPIISLTKERYEIYKLLIEKYNWKLTRKIKGFYKEGVEELFFNVPESNTVYK